MRKKLKLFGLVYILTLFLWVFNVTESLGADSRYVELPNTTGAVPSLYVNGNLQTPLASSQQDVLISFCSGKQEWKLLQEYTEWDNVNRFGYYTDLGVGHNTVLVFSGPDAAGAKDTTNITAGARIGLWLLNDQNGNGHYDGNDSYLFSERMLTRGSTVGEHQWFMVYDVSAFKGTGATYFFDTFTEDFTTSGDFDYLIYIDDDHTDANMDHNDMIVGAISLGNPPVITAPDSTKILCNPDTIRFTVTATDIDAGDSLTLQKTSGPGTFNTVTGTSPLSGLLKYYVTASGTYNFIFKATDKCGKVDYDTSTYIITMNSAPTVTGPADKNIALCTLPATISVKPFTFSDPNNNIQSKSTSKGTLSGDSVYYTATTSGPDTIIVTVTDSCGALDKDTVIVTKTVNSPPVVTGPDSSKFFCGPDTIRFTVTATDPNSGDTLTLSGPGIATPIKGLSPLSANIKIYINSAGTYDYIYTVTDKCGATDKDTATWVISFNSPPSVTAPDSNKFICYTNDSVNFNVNATDPNTGQNLILEKVSGPGSFTTVNGSSPLTGTQKWAPSAAGTYNFIYKVTDACSAVDYDTATWIISLDPPPVVSAPDSNKFLCGPDTIRFTVTATDGNPNDTISLYKYSGPGTFNMLNGYPPLSGVLKYYVTASGTYEFIFKSVDKCSRYDFDTATYVITINSPPTVTAPDNNKFICNPGDSVNFNVSATDPNTGQNLTLEKISGPGSFTTINGTSPLTGAQKWAPTTAGTYNFIYKVTDACGVVDYDTATWVVTVNSPPVVTGPADKNIALCSLPATISVKPFTFSDTDNNIQSKSTNKGTLSGDSVYYTVTTSVPDTIIVTVTDSCGALDKDTVIVNKSVNSPPVVTGPADKNIALCSLPATISVKPFTFSDTDNNIQSKSTNKGTLSGDSVYYTATTSVPDTIIVTVTDSCGALDKDTVIVTKSVNSPPVVTGPADKNIALCSLPATISVKPFTFSDTDNNIQSKSTNKGTLSGDSVYYTATTSVPDTIIVTVTDSCGALDKDTVIVNKSVNSPPVVTGPADKNIALCSLPATISVKPFTFSDTDNNIQSKSTNKGTLSGDSVYYTVTTSVPDTIIVTVTDSCGALDKDTVIVNKSVNSPPVVTSPADKNIALCSLPATISVKPFTFSDTDNNIQSKSTNKGTLSGDSVYYTVTTSVPDTIIVTVTDSCGALDKDTVIVNKSVNSPPVVTSPADKNIALCSLPATISVKPFTFSDTDNNIQSKSTNKGTLSGDSVYYTATTSVPDIIIVTVTDSCGALDKDTVIVNKSVNSPPVVTSPDSTKFLCTSGVIGFTVTATDPDPGDTITLEGSGIPTPKKGVNNVSANVQFNITSSGTYNYVYKVTNGCGAADYDTATWIITINSLPTLVVPQTISACLGDTAKFAVKGDDPDKDYNITLEKLSGVGDFPPRNGKPPLTGEWSWIPSPSDTLNNPHKVVFRVTDHCGAYVIDTVYVTVQNCACDIYVKIGEVDCANPGDTVSVPILLKTSTPIGGFDLRIEFDPTIFYFLNVTRGDGLSADWEYFTYRQLPCPMCGCCKYKLLLLGFYDIKDLHAGIPIEPNSDYVELARVKFKVANDNNLRGFFTNVCFEWDEGECTQNTFSDPTGYILYVSSNPEEFNYAECDTQYHPGNEVLNRVCFEPCGGVLICTTGKKVRGDINLNLIAYDPADLTLFSSYFIYGTSVFTIDPPVQIANTDINADGYPLSLSDFILMIRIILNDASAIPKPTPGSDLATIYVSQGKVSTNANLGAALFTFKGEGKVSSNLTFEQGVVDGNMKVLVYMNSGAGLTGELLTVSGATLDKIEAVDNFGRPVKTTLVNKVIPTAFALYPNYPNPFNPTTNISFALPEDSRVSLKIYNLSGQIVKTVIDANLPAGTFTVIWDGINSSDERVASGIYFYKLTAGNYSQTRKMCLMK